MDVTSHGYVITSAFHLPFGILYVLYENAVAQVVGVQFIPSGDPSSLPLPLLPIKCRNFQGVLIVLPPWIISLSLWSSMAIIVCLVQLEHKRKYHFPLWNDKVSTTFTALSHRYIWNHFLQSLFLFHQRCSQFLPGASSFCAGHVGCTVSSSIKLGAGPWIRAPGAAAEVQANTGRQHQGTAFVCNERKFKKFIWKRILTTFVHHCTSTSR